MSEDCCKGESLNGDPNALHTHDCPVYRANCDAWARQAQPAMQAADAKLEETRDTPTPEQAAHVLYTFGSGGYRAGDFTVCLIEAIQRADPENRRKLALGFPGYVTAVNWAMNDLDGIDRLREAAGSLAGRAQP